jgi:choline-sulfatase
MPSSTQRPVVTATGRYSGLLNSFLWLSDTETMTDDAIRGMRRAYAADITIIDDAIGRMVDTLASRGLLENTWVIYTSDHGEMGGNHGLMSKCVLYQQAVRVPLVMRPPGGCAPHTVDALVEHFDVSATVREIAGAAYATSDANGDPVPRSVAVSENWGFASFETKEHKIVVDEDAGTPCQLFDLREDPDEDHDLLGDPSEKPTVDHLMETYVRPFFRTPPSRPHPSLFTS